VEPKIDPIEKESKPPLSPLPPKLKPIDKGTKTPPSVKAKPALAVTITWDTTSDVDLRVTEPDGEECYYENMRTKNGGVLHGDVRTGFGPERYTNAKAPPGEYIIAVHHYEAAGPTQVRIRVTLHAGTPQELRRSYTVTLEAQGDYVEVCRVNVQSN
jgi:uncharacterized protein YfaP (DUF2135 family)